jgi:acyl-CoA thioester hydrolase
MENRAAMNGFKTTLEVQTRFRDTDAMGHVNNAVYLSYIELARMEYVKQVFGVTHYGGVDFILARAEVDYRSPTMPGETLVVGVKVSRTGGASFDFVYRVEDKASGRLVAEAKTVQVSYDYKAGKVKRLSQEFLKGVRAHDNVPA